MGLAHYTELYDRTMLQKGKKKNVCTKRKEEKNEILTQR